MERVVYFSCMARMRVRRALLLSGLFGLAWFGAACGTDDPPATLFVEDAASDAVVVGVPEDAGPFLVQLSNNGVVDFGLSECGGAAPAPQTITLKNTGPVPLVYRAALDSVGTFFITAGAMGVVPQKGMASITLIAQPVPSSTKAGAKVTATLTLSDSYGHTPLSLPVTITAQGGVLTVSPGAAKFASTALSAQATDVPLTITNTGNEAMAVIVTTPTDADFSVLWTGSPASTMLGPGKTLPMALARFVPTTSGAHTGEATIVPTGALCNSAPAKITFTGAGGPEADAGADASADAGTDAADSGITDARADGPG